MKLRSVSLLESARPLSLAERVALLDVAPTAQPDVNHSGQYRNSSITAPMGSSLSCPKPRTIAAEYLLALSEIDDWLASGKTQHRTTKDESNATDQHDTEQDDDAPLPRQTYKGAESGRKVTPRNSRLAREPVRNRTAAMKYRERRKLQVDSLVRESRVQQNLLVVQRQLVSSLREEVRLLQQAYSTTVERRNPTAGRLGQGTKEDVI